MMSLSATGVYLAALKHQPGNILGGTLTFYLVTTAWLTARRKDAGTGIFDWGALLIVLAVTATEMTLGLEAAISPTGLKYDYPPGPYFFLGSIALLATVGDIRMLVRGGIAGTQRLSAASLAHVLCAVHRRSVHIPGAATNISRDITEDRRTCFPECPAADIDDFLVIPSPLRKCIQENRTGGGRLTTIIGCTLKLDLARSDDYEYASEERPDCEKRPRVSIPDLRLSSICSPYWREESSSSFTAGWAS